MNLSARVSALEAAFTIEAEKLDAARSEALTGILIELFEEYPATHKLYVELLDSQPGGLNEAPPADKMWEIIETALKSEPAAYEEFKRRIAVLSRTSPTEY